jgi:CRP-like cAMP-binding protein
VFSNEKEPQHDHEFVIRVKVANVPEGAFFGELALMNDKPRAATIATAVGCVFATLDKADFKRIMQKALEKSMNDKIFFL